jgi:STAM-binding protein
MAPTILDTSASSRSQYPIPRPKSRRPASLAELAERARNNGWDPNLGIKHWLKTSERHRSNGNNLVQSGDLEAGFVELATAATLVMEKVPSHRDYHTMLNQNLRKNLGIVSINRIDLV